MMQMLFDAAQGQGYGYGTGSNPNSHGGSGYTRSNGTCVEPYRATNPDGTQRDNYGTPSNVGGYTGAVGTRGAEY